MQYYPLEASLEVNALYNELFEAAERAAPKEMCGLIVQQGDKKVFIESQNFSEDPENSFKIDPKLYVKHQLLSNILYVVHSHYMQDCKPSQADKNNADFLKIPYMIVSYPDKEIEIYDPS